MCKNVTIWADSLVQTLLFLFFNFFFTQACIFFWKFCSDCLCFVQFLSRPKSKIFVCGPTKKENPAKRLINQAFWRGEATPGIDSTLYFKKYWDFVSFSVGLLCFWILVCELLLLKITNHFNWLIFWSKIIFFCNFYA